MASITIRNLDVDVITRLRVRATEHHRSMEEEARIILSNAVNSDRVGPRDLAKFTRDCFASLGGVELELPTRGPMREPPTRNSESPTGPSQRRVFPDTQVNSHGVERA